jgi:hypothetical protein
MMAGGFADYITSSWIAAPVAAYYVCAWLAVGRKRSSRSVAVRYEPPEDLSPAAMRYVYTMGCDGRTYAAVVTQLAAQKLIDIIPDFTTGKVILKRLAEHAHLRRGLAQEEARVFHDLFEWSDQVELRRPDISALQRLQKMLDERSTAAYFTRNFIWALPGLILTGVGTAWFGLSSGMFGHDSVDAWTGAVFAGLTVAMYGLAGYWTWDTNRLAFTLALRGIYRRRTLPALLAFIFLYPALWFILIRTVAPGFAVVTTVLILLNAFAGPCLRNHTSAGRKMRDEIEGFREFLRGVEHDRLERLNQPGQRAQVDSEMIPFAIALDLSESWGDQLGIKVMMETDL